MQNVRHRDPSQMVGSGPGPPCCEESACHNTARGKTVARLKVGKMLVNRPICIYVCFGDDFLRFWGKLVGWTGLGMSTS